MTVPENPEHRALAPLQAAKAAAWQAILDAPMDASTEEIRRLIAAHADAAEALRRAELRERYPNGSLLDV